ncbi:hypothetical protein [Psychrobacter phenylpyruvicus]|uniref:Uncharacterized protein n=2 Tax=Psychrobacter phenylpyruvicus TaxID=29432 RepID=A0A379LLG3_9GAMM|nr:hypothetical protein [Psychrobacter phenylpyruvicus]SUD90614.1 Uncharacterised protein [Psychrobacter phenylpyruvicus]
MANIQTDSEGNQGSGTLNFTTDTLTTKDIINTATNDQRNLGGSMSIGTGKQGQSINNVGVQVGHTANDFESVTNEPPRLYRRVDCLSQAALSDSLRLS